MISRLKRWLKWLLRRMGYRLVPSERGFGDLRDLSDDPIRALYVSGSQPFLVNVSLDRLRALEGVALPCLPERGNPLVETALCIREGRCKGYPGSPLEYFYDRWTPANAAEALELDRMDTSPRLRQLPPHLAVLPWFPLSPEELADLRNPIILRENRSWGADLGIEHGTVLAGPLSGEKGALEFRRIEALVRSVEERGYVVPTSADEHIGGVLLIRGDEWRVLLRNGNHRVAVLAALGASTAPILFTATETSPRRCESGSWPRVKTGLFTEEQALAIFDRMFEGRPPAGCPGPRKM